MPDAGRLSWIFRLFAGRRGLWLALAVALAGRGAARLFVERQIVRHSLWHHPDPLIVAQGRASAPKTARETNATSQHPLLLFPDSEDFHAAAVNLLRQGEYVDGVGRHAWRTPGYSLLLAAWYGVWGTEPATGRWVNFLLDLFNVALVWRLARALAPPGVAASRIDLAAGLAALLYALDPWAAYWSALILCETLGTTFTLLTVWAFQAAAKRAGWIPGYPPSPTAERWLPPGALRGAALCAAAAGMAWGWAIFAKPSLAGLGVFLALGWLAVVWRERRGAGKTGTLVVMAMLAGLGLLLLSPLAAWAHRNGRLFGASVPLTTMGSFSLYESVGPGADGGPNFGKTRFPPGFDARPPVNPAQELENDRVLGRAVREAMRTDPWRVVGMMPGKIARTWNPLPNWEGARGAGALVGVASAGAWLLVIPAVLWGAWRWRRAWPTWIWAVLPALYITALHSIYLGSIRYRAPAMAALVVLAAWGYVGLMRDGVTAPEPGEPPAPPRPS